MTTIDPNLMARVAVLQDHLDETMRAGAGTLRELVEAYGEALMELDGARADLREASKRRDWHNGEATDAKGELATVRLERNEAMVTLATLDRVCVVADEAFGPFPVQSAEDALTEIEHGIALMRREMEIVRSALTDPARIDRMALALADRFGSGPGVTLDRFRVVAASLLRRADGIDE